MSRRQVILFAVSLMLMVFVALPALAVTYSGSLNYTPPYPANSADGLFVGPSDLQWGTYAVSMSWTVTNQGSTYAGYPWEYTYTFQFSGNQSGVSHIIIEGSDGIQASDIKGLTNATLESIGLQTVHSGNPNMPENMNGLRFDPVTSSPTSMTWSFFCDRAPVWGDFYARGGGKSGEINYAINYNKTNGTASGFTVNDVDPTAPACNGSVGYSILRPDTRSVVPEPSGVLALLGGLGSFGIFALRKRS